jgi:RNA polymerase sigma factor (sigma-70 family)
MAMSATSLNGVLGHLRRLALRSYAEASDGQLLERYAGRQEQAALAALVERHGPMVLGLCRRLVRDEHDAEDAFQATFLILLRKAASIRRPELLGNWLYGVAYRVALRLRAQTLRRRQQERALDSIEPAAPQAESLRDDLAPLLDQEICRLSEKHRRVFVLCCLDGKTCAEAARLLHCPEGTIKSRLARARDQLQARLARRGVSPSPAMLAAPVSTALVDATVNFATGAASGSAAITALAEGAMHAMTLSRMKLVALFLLVAGIFATGAGLFLHHALAQRTEPGGDVAESPPPAKDQLVEADPLPPGAVQRIGSLRLRHAGPVLALAFAPSGKRAASASQDGTLRVWDTATGKELDRYDDHRGPVTCAACSADGKILASGGDDRTVRLRDAATGKLLHALDDHDGPIQRIVFSPDSKMLAAESRNVLHLWQVATGKRLQRLGEVAQGPTSGVLVGFMPDGKTVVSLERTRTVVFWDVASGKEVRQFNVDLRGVVGISSALSGDGKMLALGDRADAAPGALTLRSRVSLWDVAGGKKIREAMAEDGIANLAFSADGKTLAAACYHQTARLWNVGTGKELPPCAGQRTDGSDRAFSVAFSADGRTLATGGSQRVRLWEVATQKERLLPGGWLPINVLCFSRDGKTLALGCERTIRLADRQTGQEIRSLYGDEGIVDGLAFFPDGKTLASTGWSNSIRLWDVSTGKELRRIGGDERVRPFLNAKSPIAVSADGKTIASRSAGSRLVLWDVATGKGRQLNKGLGSGHTLAFSPDGKTLAAPEDDNSEVVLWDVATGRAQKRLRASLVWTSALAFSPDGKQVASVSHNGLAHVWDVKTGKMARMLGKANLGVPQMEDGDIKSWGLHSVGFCDGGKTLMTADKDQVRLWELQTGKLLSVFDQGHQKRITSAACWDGKLVASGSHDSTVLVWDPAARVAEKKQDPKAGDPSALLELLLVAKKKEYKADPEARDKLKFHEVDLELHLQNPTKTAIKVRLVERPGLVGDEIELPGGKKVKLEKEELEPLKRSTPPAGYLGMKLDLKGPITSVGQYGGGIGGLKYPTREVTIAPGKSHTLPIKTLTYPGKEGASTHYFACTQAGDYTLTVVLETAISPAPTGSKNAGQGFGYVTLGSNTVKLKFVEAGR